MWPLYIQENTLFYVLRDKTRSLIDTVERVQATMYCTLCGIHILHMQMLRNELLLLSNANYQIFI
jgi:hypothetical protein